MEIFLFMTTMTKTIEISNHSDILLQEVLQGVSRLETTDIEQFMLNIGQLLAARKSAHLDKKETQLLKAIHKSVPTLLLERYNELVLKSEAETITSLENEEFIALHEKMEQYNAKRYKKIVDLARYRGVSVPTIMQQFNLFTNVAA